MICHITNTITQTQLHTFSNNPTKINKVPNLTITSDLYKWTVRQNRFAFGVFSFAKHRNKFCSKIRMHINVFLLLKINFEEIYSQIIKSVIIQTLGVRCISFQKCN